MVQIVLIRPGATEYDQQGRVQGTLDIPLCEDGRQEIEVLVYRQWQEQPETVCPPQGETLIAAKQRVQALVAKLLKKHKTDRLVAVVVPEPLASVIRNVLRHDDWGDLWQSATESPQWQVIDVPETVAAK